MIIRKPGEKLKMTEAPKNDLKVLIDKIDKLEKKIDKLFRSMNLK